MIKERCSLVGERINVRRSGISLGFEVFLLILLLGHTVQQFFRCWMRVHKDFGLWKFFVVGSHIEVV